MAFYANEKGSNFLTKKIVSIVMTCILPLFSGQDLTSLQFVSESHENLASFCETETFNATCPPDHVVLITHARYGRMRLSRCVKLDYGYVGCSSDVISVADWRCSGRRKCEIRVPDAEFGKAKPCPDDLKPYLEIGYSCVKVVKPPFSSCTHPGSSRAAALAPSADEGVIASLVTEVTGCGRLRVPWRVEVFPGQTIQVSLFDFGLHGHRKPPSHPGTGSGCSVYAVLWESLVPEARNVTVCGGIRRHATVYLSTSHRLEVAIINNDNGHHPPYFLLHYQALGCAELPPLPNAWSVRNGDGAMIRCNFTKDVFHLRCSGHRWIGDVANCSSAFSIGVSLEKNATTSTLSIPYGLSVAIVLLIAFTIGIFVLFSGLLFLKRQRRGCARECETPDDVIEKDYVTAASIQRTFDCDVDSWPNRSLRGSRNRLSGYSSDAGRPYRVKDDQSNGSRSLTAPADKMKPPPLYGCQSCYEAVGGRRYQSCANNTESSPRLSRTWRPTWRPMAAAAAAAAESQSAQYFVVNRRSSSVPRAGSTSPNSSLSSGVQLRSKYLPQRDDTVLRGERAGDISLASTAGVPQLVAECRPLIYPHDMTLTVGNFSCPSSPPPPPNHHHHHHHHHRVYSAISTVNLSEGRELENDQVLQMDTAIG